jgi:hypothetical protein
MTTAPLFAVHVGRQVPAALGEVLTATTSWWEPVAASDSDPAPPGTVGHLYASDVLPPRPATPFAVWQVHNQGSPAPQAVVAIGEVGAPDAVHVDLWSCSLPWPEEARPILPFTRGRYRELRGLPARLVTEAVGDELRWGPPDGIPRSATTGSWPTLAALSSVVVAEGQQVWSALAWAAPVVTDPGTAARLTLTDGEHVLVGADRQARLALATTLAADETRCSTLGQRGWSAASARRTHRVAKELCARFGITRRREAAPASQLIEALDALGTPRASLVRHRAREATAVLPGAVTQGWRPIERNIHARL